jgi:hypothetical protein
MPAALGQTAIEGGGSFNDAPLLTPGVYGDRIRPGERVFWGFEARYGQHVNVSVAITPVGKRDSIGTATFLRVYSPHREQQGSGDSVRFDASEARTITRAGAIDPHGDDYNEEGVYFASVLMEDSDSFRDRDFPLRLTIEVTGTTVPTTIPSASATTPATQDPAAAPTSKKESLWPDRGAGGAAGLVAGFGIATALVLRRRPAGAAEG